MWTAGVAGWVAIYSYSYSYPSPPPLLTHVSLTYPLTSTRSSDVASLAVAEGDSVARQMEMKRLCCFIAAIRKNEALFRCFKQSFPLLRFLLRPLRIHYRLHNRTLLFICTFFYINTRIFIFARGTETGHRLSFCFAVFIRGMRQFPLQSPDLEIFSVASPLLLNVAMSWRFFFVFPVGYRKSCGCIKMIVAFHFQPSNRMNYLRFQQLI